MSFITILTGVILFVCFNMTLMAIFSNRLLYWNEEIPEHKWKYLHFDFEQTTEEFAEEFINEIIENKKKRKLEKYNKEIKKDA